MYKGREDATTRLVKSTRIGGIRLFTHDESIESRYSVFSLKHYIWCSLIAIVGLGSIHSIGAPIQVYPLYENAYRAARGQSIADNNKESAQLYAEFAKVAEKNKAAWNYGKPAETQDSIGTVTKRNRMICFPCGFR